MGLTVVSNTDIASVVLSTVFVFVFDQPVRLRVNVVWEDAVCVPT